MWRTIKQHLPNTNYTIFHNKLISSPARWKKIKTCHKNCNMPLADIKIYSRTSDQNNQHFRLKIQIKIIGRKVNSKEKALSVSLWYDQNRSVQQVNKIINVRVIAAKYLKLRSQKYMIKIYSRLYKNFFSDFFTLISPPPSTY